MPAIRAEVRDRRDIVVAALALAALAFMIGAYFAPVWWVSLTAPNYPKDAFPDGIRIHFHFNGVYNGCTAVPTGSLHQKEILQQDLSGEVARYNPILEAKKDINQGAQGLDCVHEMNTINHYVGMYPIGSGAPVERPMAKFFIGFFAVMLVAFALPWQRPRLAVLATGFLAVAVWTVVDLHALGHLEQFVRGYEEETGTYFREPEKIAGWADTLRFTLNATMIGLIVVMAIVLAGAWRIRGFTLLLALVPALLPLYFVVDYSIWLWFFGHNLNPWAAFTVKPFMPTVFGEGHVAQFSTYSYPHWGYALLTAVFLLLVPALLIRRQQLREQSVGR